MKLQLYYPVAPFKVLQGFGVNGAYYQAHGINIKGHNGLDLLASHGQPIYASHDGTAYYEVDGDQGHGVILITKDLYDYPDGTQGHFKTIYWHMVDSSKEPQFRSPVEGHTVPGIGLDVKMGDLLGYADNTGLSTGDHLHFGLKMVTPGEIDSTWISTGTDNGYMGAIDPTPYLNGLYASQASNTTARHTFYLPMRYGDQGSEVLALQRCLQSIGYFPQTVQPTGFYGSVTRGAVFQFQQDYMCKSWAPSNWPTIAAVWTSMGNNVGSLTIPYLNKVFAS